jgi:uncharacterized RDD family membrane protein YckC
LSEHDTWPSTNAETHHSQDRCPRCEGRVVLGASYCAKCGRPLHEHDLLKAGERAGFWRRFAAFAFDQILVALFMIPLSFVPTSWAAFVLILLIHLGYNVGFNTVSGQTLGKRLLGIRVIPIDGSRLTWRKAFLRWIGYGGSSLALNLGFLWAAWDSESQTWHDKLAGTCVVAIAPSQESARTLLHPEYVRRKQRRWAPVLLIPFLVIGIAVGAVFGIGHFMGIGEAESVVKEFMEAARDQDFAAACELCEGVDQDELAEFIGNRRLFQGFSRIHLSGWHISSSSGRPTTAKLAGSVSYDDGRKNGFEASLVKLGDEWKITAMTIGW